MKLNYKNKKKDTKAIATNDSKYSNDKGTNNLLSKYILNKNINSQGFFLGFILNKLDLNIPDRIASEPLLQFSLAMFLLSITCLLIIIVSSLGILGKTFF